MLSSQFIMFAYHISRFVNYSGLQLYIYKLNNMVGILHEWNNDRWLQVQCVLIVFNYYCHCI